MGEKWFGLARGVSTMVFIAIGAGIGMGIIIEDELVRGVELAGAGDATARSVVEHVASRPGGSDRRRVRDRRCGAGSTGR